MAEYINPYAASRDKVLSESLQGVLTTLQNTERKLRAQQEASQAELTKTIEDIGNQRAKFGFVGKRLCVELLDGRHDGLILDSESGDPTDRELVRLLRFSSAFERVQVVETDTEAFIQLRPKPKPAS